MRRPRARCRAWGAWTSRRSWGWRRTAPSTRRWPAVRARRAHMLRAARSCARWWRARATCLRRSDPPCPSTWRNACPSACWSPAGRTARQAATGWGGATSSARPRTHRPAQLARRWPRSWGWSRPSPFLRRIAKWAQMGRCRSSSPRAACGCTTTCSTWGNRRPTRWRRVSSAPCPSMPRSAVRAACARCSVPRAPSRSSTRAACSASCTVRAPACSAACASTSVPSRPSR